ncbi:dirigent protein 21 [Phtheirospermum japonicum]|uniref:Dirigent protein n=1 Tax=Phtheirospermum japonicum TaxID=374723 RepID=A0A830C527_9LAMI|nr:dirigent protein 21 [Phtheirospermum japonicum]
MEDVSAESASPKPMDKWYQNLDHAKEIRTKLHFYIQDVLSGDNPMVLKVAESQITITSPTAFGQISMLDDLLTAGPEPGSEVVGRAQGTISFAMAIQMGLNIVFTEGKYKGSTISILGRNPLVEKYRELAIVGGTGFFRMARGIVVSNTHSFDTSTNYGV